MLAQDKISLYALVGDMKETIYHQMLVISALSELLQEKGIFDSAALEQKLAALKRQDELCLRRS